MPGSDPGKLCDLEQETSQCPRLPHLYSGDISMPIPQGCCEDYKSYYQYRAGAQ